MRILSLNAWHGTCASELESFLASQFDSVDIYCFQETNGKNMASIMATFFDATHFSSVQVAKKADQDRYYSLHTFARKPFEITTTAHLFSDNDTETGQALATNIKVNDNTSVAVVNMHGVPLIVDDKLDTEGRLRQTETVITRLSTNNLPSIICGDFNLLPNTKSITNFKAAGYQNLITDYNIPTTRNRLAWEKHPGNIQRFADYTFVSPTLKVAKFIVPKIEISDHLPMITDVIL